MLRLAVVIVALLAAAGGVRADPVTDEIRAMREDAELRERFRRDRETQRDLADGMRSITEQWSERMSAQRQADELRRIGNELEDLNALERQRDMTRPRF